MLFVLRNWADGTTQAELAAATGLSERQVARLIAEAPGFIKHGLEPLPQVIGIDELHFRNQYHSVITDMSRKGETHLIDIVEGRPEGNSSNMPKQVYYSAYLPDSEEAKKTARIQHAALGGALEKLADQYVAHPDWRIGGNRLLYPILTTDGWGSFRETMGQSFGNSAMRAGLSPGSSIFTADLFHLQRNVFKQVHNAQRVIDWAYERVTKTDLDNARTLLQNGLDHVRLKEQSRQYSDVMSRATRDSIAGRSHHMVLLCRRDRELEPVFELFHERLLKQFGRPDFIPPEDGEAWEKLLRLIHDEVVDAVKMKNKAALAEANLLLRGREKDEDQEEILGVANASVKYINNGETRQLRAWMDAMERFDAHPLTRLPDGPFSFTQLDIAWSGKGRDSHTRTIRRPTRAARLVEESTRVAIVEVLEVDLESVRIGQPDLAARVEKLQRHFALPVNAMVENRLHVKPLIKAEKINDEMDDAGYPAPFNIYRPSNARTERLNRSIRRILVTCSPTMSFTDIRTRLLARLSAKTLIPALTPPKITELNLPALTVCPECGSPDLVISATESDKVLTADVPIGWEPTKYLAVTPKWACNRCSAKSKRVRALQVTPALHAYLQRLAESPRLVSASVNLWHRRTGAPKRMLRSLLQGPVDLFTPTEEDPAVVIGLSITSDGFKDRENNRTPRVLLVDLRHRGIKPKPGGNGKLLPARVVAHEHMNLDNVKERLRELSEIAGQPLKLFLDAPVWGWPEWRDALLDNPADNEAEAGAAEVPWQTLIDANTALNMIRKYANATVAYWRRNTSIPIRKEERHHKSETDYSEEARAARSQAKAAMKDIFSKGLNRYEDKDKNETKDNRLHKRITLDSMYKLVHPPEDAAPDADYYSEDIISFHRHLTGWWNAIRGISGQENVEAIRKRTGSFVRLYKHPPEMHSAGMKEISEGLQEDLKRHLKYLTGTKRHADDLIAPDTHTGDFHAAKLGPLKNRVKREGVHRGRAK